MNNYQAAAQGFGPPASPHAANTRGGFPAANSPGPTIDMYNSSAADSVGYVQAASPQPSSFPAIAVSRAPLNYSPRAKMALPALAETPPTLKMTQRQDKLQFLWVIPLKSKLPKRLNGR
ncbi:unnamed protein product [Brassicogethes aeneus]|uniref:Uncharacterized protein n=1 Tax=Brassicogethes aeneus TaxID=1431903 RepID=A0A9P0FI84_BRAAE|nr:unnamed protein product [Brassicogethes aeneus]